MIVNKKLKGLYGTVEYEVVFNEHHSFFSDFDDEEEIMEYKKFSDLNGLIKCLSEETLDKIKADYDDVKEVVVNSIILLSSSEDEDTSARLTVSNGVHGFVSTKIENQDIDNRLLLNIQKMKRIIENTLEEFPTKF